jgi:ribA/ribD-fused uncharacterized protein
MEKELILFYGGQWGCFSNMSSYAVEIDGKVFMTSEHVYQYSKFTDEEVRNKIFSARSGYDAKMIALENKSLTIPNWHEKSLDTMEMILRKKLDQHPHIKDKLLETGNREIIEASPTDAFWGWGSDKKGENHHGKIWMKLRSEILP